MKSRVNAIETLLLLLLLLLGRLQITTSTAESALERPCDQLRLGQFRCAPPVVDPFTQSELNCSSARLVAVPCYPAPDVACAGRRFDGRSVGFYRNVSCRYVTHYEYETAALLSIFLGVFGVDRFYLGYWAVGALKLSTFGFMLIGYLVDMILIVTQELGPADGSDYICDYYQQIIKSPGFNNWTFNSTR